ncbi:hypothetical protein CR513_60530, partial [Mucuna pruriens]
MAHSKTNLCTHLTLGMCYCKPTKTKAFRSSSTKKKKHCIKVHVAERKKKSNDGNSLKIKKTLKESDFGNMRIFIFGTDITKARVDAVDEGVAILQKAMLSLSIEKK